MSALPLTIAVRAHVERVQKRRTKPTPRAPRVWKGWPRAVLIIDTETTVDAVQRLTFGSYRYCRWSKGGELRCIQEGLVYGDDLPERDRRGFAVLKRYSKAHRADVALRGDPRLHLVSRREFVQRVLWTAHRAEALVVGFNLPFDLSRLAIECGSARARYYGGFSLMLWDYFDARSDTYRENRNRPRVCILSLDSKRAFIGCSKPARNDRALTKTNDSTIGGHFLDARTLAFSLTGAAHSLGSAGKTFGVSNHKQSTALHGRITSGYIDYNRGDVRATLELLEREREEFDYHTIGLDPCKAYSPASMAKAYFRAMGITAPRVKFATVPPEVLGQTMTAYYGGRTECRIRWTEIPVVYCDFLSMYPSVNALLGLWQVVIAGRLEIVDVTREVRKLLQTVDQDDCFDKELWRKLAFFAEIEPCGDVLPVRAQYDVATEDFAIGVNPVMSGPRLFYAGPDLVASKVLTGRAPRIVRAFRFVPRGVQEELRAVTLRGSVTVDPSEQDFFRVVIEARRQTERRIDLPAAERKRLGDFLKVLSNSASYGVFAEMNQQDLRPGEHVSVRVFGMDGSHEHRTIAPESPGTFCFAPLAALVTSGARLMLALLERAVAAAGGTYAFCDTDSMAIVATANGGLVRCQSGEERTEDGRPAVRALTWSAIDAIVARFESLKPYDPIAVTEPLLKVEEHNFDARDRGKRKQLYALAISAKRYALYNIGKGGQVTLRKASEHGLGHLLDPTRGAGDSAAAAKPDENPEWIRTMWLMIIGEARGKRVRRPLWFRRPALSRVTVSTPEILHLFTKKSDRPYADRVKPYGFLVSVHVASFGHPPRRHVRNGRRYTTAHAEPSRFHLLAPYASDPRLWRRLPWRDRATGRRYHITTRPAYEVTDAVAVKSYGDVFDAYRMHAEPKSVDADGEPCGRATRGVLDRRPVNIGRLVLIGKEANRIEEVMAGLVHDQSDVLDVLDLSDPVWNNIVLPRLRSINRTTLAAAANLTKRQIRNLLAARNRPSDVTRRLLTQLILAADHERSGRLQ